MNNLSLRIYVLLSTALMYISAWAQDEDDDDASGILELGGRPDGPDELGELMDYQPIHFSLTDIIAVVLLLVACYVFGKIWKGCSYLLLLLAAILYFMAR